MPEQATTADEATTPRTEAHDAFASPADPPAAVDRGECPLCGEEFDDAAAFRDHLGGAHDLYDEEGTASVLMLPTITTIEPTQPTAGTISLGPSRAQARTAPRQKFPVGLAVLVLLLLLLGGGLVYFMRPAGHSEVAGSDATTQPLDGAASLPAASPDASDPLGAGDAAVFDGGAVSGSSPGAPSTDTTATPDGSVTAPTAATSSVAAAPPPSATVPPPSFVAPTTSGAAVVSCARDHGQWTVTYSWQFVGGTGWTPLAGYTSLGSGRYQSTAKLAPGGNAQITAVQVTDSTGTRHSVSLNPSLSTSGC